MVRAVTWIVMSLLVLVIGGCGDESSETPTESKPEVATGLSDDTYFNTKYGLSISDLPVDTWTVRDVGGERQGSLMDPQEGFIDHCMLLVMEPVPAEEFVGLDEAGTIQPALDANIPCIFVGASYEKGLRFETHQLTELLELSVPLWGAEIESKKPVFIGKWSGIQAIIYYSDTNEKAAITWFAKDEVIVRCEYYASVDQFDKHLDTYQQILKDIWLLGK